MQNPAADQLIPLADSLLSIACDNHERRLLVISGEQARVLTLARQWVQHAAIRQACWIGADAPEHITTLTPSQATSTLGGEHRLIVFNAWSGLHPDAFCVLAGTLAGGGLMLLLTPPLPQWPNMADPDYARMIPYGFDRDCITGHFIRRIAHALEGHVAIVLWNADTASAHISSACFEPVACIPSLPLQEQALALLQLEKLLVQSSPTPCVITADRGRGKSALMGRLAAHLSVKQPLRIVVTAARPEAAKSLLHWAEQTLHQLKGAGTFPEFMAPDVLTQTEINADLVLVDEAAMLPIDLLKKLISRYPRIVLATTVHGYEGTGRGLALKLFPWLHQHFPGWQHLSMKSPIRWRQGDPMEQWLADVFCLADEVSDAIPENIPFVVERIPREALAKEPALIHAVFGLLVSAHYRTTPSDLRDLLDGPNLQVWVLRQEQQIAGVCLIAEEGGFMDAALCEQIMAGKRRPRGHLLPQSLAFHCHAPRFLNARCARIVRIAIAPSLQGKGWGRHLMKEIEAQLMAEKYAVLGSSFALEPQVLKFWQGAGMHALRVGTSKESASGLPSCLVAKALLQDDTFDVEIAHLRNQFCEEAEGVLNRLLPALDKELRAALSDSTPGKTRVSARVQQRIARFIAGALPFESALGALQWGWEGLSHGNATATRLTPATASSPHKPQAFLSQDQIHQILFTPNTLQWIAKREGYTGRDALIKALRATLAHFLV